MKKRVFAVFLILLTLLSFDVTAENSENGTENGVYNRIYALQEKFPQGMCWNHLVETEDDIGLNQKKEQGRYRERFGDSVTTHTCAAHNSWETVEAGQYECNFFDGGSQCYGFARKVFYDVFGVRVSESQYRYDYKNIQVGDYVRYGDNNRGHSFIVLSKNGNEVTALECNWGERCVIYWGVHTYDLEGTITSVSGKEYTFNHYVHASNYDEINRKYSTPVLSVTPVGTYGVILGGNSYTTENPFYEGFTDRPFDYDSCVWYVWGRSYEKLGVKLAFAGKPNTWEENPGEYETGITPRENSIAVWKDGEHGHAAFVEKYEDGVLYVSESNFRVFGGDTVSESVYSEGCLDKNGVYTNTFTNSSASIPSITERKLPDYYVYLDTEKESGNRFDFDGNDIIDASDAVYLLRSIICPYKYPISEQSDVNGDGITDIADVIYLFRHVDSPDDILLRKMSEVKKRTDKQQNHLRVLLLQFMGIPLL